MQYIYICIANKKVIVYVLQKIRLAKVHIFSHIKLILTKITVTLTNLKVMASKCAA